MDATTHTIKVLLSRKDGVDAALTALAARATRKGLPVPTWSFGAVFTGNETHVVRADVPGGFAERGFENVSRIVLTLSAEPIAYDGWSFVASLAHLGEAGTIVNATPGHECPDQYKDRGPVCDHCNVSRRRENTYVLQHTDGRTVQVGSTCLDDFLGGSAAYDLAAAAAVLVSMVDIAEDDGNLFGGGRASHFDLAARYLPAVAALVRTVGWVSRGASREHGGQATADDAWTMMCDPGGPAITAEDRQAAVDAMTWALALTDADIGRETGDYLRNVRIVARAGYVDSRTMGIGASIVVAHQRAIGRERLRAERATRPNLDIHLGKPGEKVSFGLPAKVGKKGQPLKGAPTVITADAVTLDFVTGYATEYGYTTVLKFRTDTGATVVWKASTDTGVGRDDVGKRFTLSGTVKAHGDYKGAKQTILSRCALAEVEAAADAPSEQKAAA